MAKIIRFSLYCIFTVIIGAAIFNSFQPNEFTIRIDLIRYLIFTESVKDLTGVSPQSTELMATHPEFIVIHHDEVLQSAFENAPIMAIYNYHLHKFGNFAYHYYIDKYGIIYKIHNENIKLIGENIHVCFSGNFDIEEPTKLQLNSYRIIKNHFLAVYPNLLIIGHRDISNKTCPGNNFIL